MRFIKLREQRHLPYFMPCSLPSLHLSHKYNILSQTYKECTLHEILIDVDKVSDHCSNNTWVFNYTSLYDGYKCVRQQTWREHMNADCTSRLKSLVDNVDKCSSIANVDFVEPSNNNNSGESLGYESLQGESSASSLDPVSPTDSSHESDSMKPEQEDKNFRHLKTKDKQMPLRERVQYRRQVLIPENSSTCSDDIMNSQSEARLVRKTQIEKRRYNKGNKFLTASVLRIKSNQEILSPLDSKRDSNLSDLSESGSNCLSNSDYGDNPPISADLIPVTFKESEYEEDRNMRASWFAEEEPWTFAQRLPTSHNLAVETCETEVETEVDDETETETYHHEGAIYTETSKSTQPGAEILDALEKAHQERIRVCDLLCKTQLQRDFKTNYGISLNDDNAILFLKQLRNGEKLDVRHIVDQSPEAVTARLLHGGEYTEFLLALSAPSNPKERDFFQVHMKTFIKQYPFYSTKDEENFIHELIERSDDFSRRIRVFMRDVAGDRTKAVNEIIIVLNSYGDRHQCVLQGQSRGTITAHVGGDILLDDIIQAAISESEKAKRNNPNLRFLTILLTSCYGHLHSSVTDRDICIDALATSDNPLVRFLRETDPGLEQYNANLTRARTNTAPLGVGDPQTETSSLYEIEQIDF